ncbi:gluconokinase [Psittacicella hinzii]|nr:gluconokinase [Psittacicella hinzii]
MGVSGTGKSSVGLALAQLLQVKFIDGDDLHPQANIQKMAAGIPLTDADRAPWLERIRDAFFAFNRKNEAGIIVCSALKNEYRELIRQGNSNLKFIHLHGDFNVIAQRLEQRQGHFMASQMLESQFQTLEMPSTNETDVALVNANVPLSQVIAQCLQQIATWQDKQSSN